jgi:hypothetical protein
MVINKKGALELAARSASSLTDRAALEPSGYLERRPIVVLVA